jgi:hypothetical protein
MVVLTLLLSSPATYAVLAAFVAMIVFSARAQPDPPPGYFHPPWCCPLLQPLPAKVRLLMQEAASRRDFPRELLASWVAAYDTKYSEAIKHINGAASRSGGLPYYRRAAGR